jgi:hypothetical protein
LRRAFSGLPSNAQQHENLAGQEKNKKKMDEGHVITRGVALWHEARNYLSGTCISSPDLTEGLRLARACRNEPGCEEAERFCAATDDVALARGDWFTDRMMSIIAEKITCTDDAETDGMFEYIAGRWAMWETDGRSSRTLWLLKRAAKAGYAAAISHLSVSVLAGKPALRAVPAETLPRGTDEKWLYPVSELIDIHTGEMVTDAYSTEFYASLSDETKERLAEEHAKVRRRFAASQGDPFGIFLCSVHDLNGRDHVLAAQLGCVEARESLQRTLPLSSLTYWTCGYKNAEMDVNDVHFVHRLTDLLAQTQGRNRERVLFHVGRLLVAHNQSNTQQQTCRVDTVAKQPVRAETGEMCYQLAAFCVECSKRALDGVLTWTLAAKATKRVVPDIRKMISRMIWDRRHLWLDWDEWWQRRQDEQKQTLARWEELRASDRAWRLKKKARQ